MPGGYRRLAKVALVFALVLVNAWGVYSALYFAATIDWQVDWRIFEAGAERIAAGANPYVELDPATHHAFRWSPIMAIVFVGVTSLPFAAWAAAHVAALYAFRDARIAVGIGLSWPFAIDVLDGGVMVFVALAAYWAYRGNRFGTAAYLALTLLIPRPLMIPLAVWVLWKRPEWRTPFAVLVLSHAIAVVAMGWHVEWVERLLTSGHDVSNSFNLGPSRWLEAAWIPVGVALAALAAWHGRLGWAALAISPYHLPQYLLMLVLEAARAREDAGRRP